MILNAIFMAVVVLLAIVGWQRYQKTQRQTFLENYRFNAILAKKVQQHYPHLQEDELQQVLEGLRDYFIICNQAGRKMVAMPSQVVDVAWHEFILFTRAYQSFCHKALGRFLHHTPSEAMPTQVSAQAGIRRAWRLACARSGINPALPSKLPLLFNIDRRLNIKDGFYYSRNCRDNSLPKNQRDGYCASHIGCASGCAGDSGAATYSGGYDGAGDSGGCSGGCGGD